MGRSVTLALPGLSLLLLCLVHTTGGISISGLPRDKYQELGDLNLGVLISVHEFTKRGFCSRYVRELGVLQRIEAVAEAVREINARDDLLRNVTLGFVMFDDCNKDVTALAQALHFIHDDDSGFCFSQDYDAGLCALNTVEAYDVIGLIGSESSTTTIQIANLLTSFKIPIVSYLATASPLSYKIKYPDFYRTVPTDSIQARVIIELLTYFNWSHVSVVYTKGVYGEQAFEALVRMADEYDVCFAQKYVIDDTWQSGNYKTMVYQMMQEIYARIIIVFTPLQEAREILKAAKIMKAEGRLTWIAGEAWGKSLNEIFPFAEYAWGAFSVNIKSSNVERFDRHFRSITPMSRNVNPWITHFWYSQFFCNIPGSVAYGRRCGSWRRLTHTPRYAPEKTVSLVYDAVYSYAHALEEITAHPECRAALNMSKSLYVKCLKSKVRQYMHNVSFEGETARVEYLEKFGYMKRHYEIYNLQNGTSGFEFVKIGVWNKTSTRLEMDNVTIQWAPYFKGKKPTSLCSQPCGVGEEMVLQQRRCCWTCEACEDNQITYHIQGIKRCTTCSNGTWPDPITRTTCDPIIPEYVNWSQPLGIVLAGLASVGLGFCVVIIIVFATNNNKPLVKASSRELSYFMLISLMLSYAFTYSFLLKPTSAVCVVRLLGISLCFTLMYAPLFTKTMRIYRIFEAGHAMNRRPTCVSSKSQICIVVNIIFFHVLLVVVSWAVVSPPTSFEHHSAPNRLQAMCVFPLVPFILSLAYNILLICVCVVFAFKARKLPDNYNESRFISFCVYSTVIIWMAFMSAYFAVDSALLEVMFLSLQVIANASLIVICIFIPKIYALYFVDKKDQHVTPKFTTQGGARRLVENHSWQDLVEESPVTTRITGIGLNTIAGTVIPEEPSEEGSNISNNDQSTCAEHNAEAIKEEHASYSCNGLMSLRLSAHVAKVHAIDGLL